MAIVEFFKIIIKNKKTNNELVKFNFSKILQNKLSDTVDAMRHCTHGVRSKCSASVGDYRKGEDNITFDLIKFQQEYIKSTLISEPNSVDDTYEILHKISVENAKYTDKDIFIVKNIIQKNSLTLFEIKEALKKNFKKINKFSIYKIIVNERLDKEEDNNCLSELFYDEFLKRYSVNKTFFNIWFYQETDNRLLMEKNSSGFTYTHLEDYFNKHLLKDEEYKVSIEYEYDKNFETILKNDKLHKFQFSIDLQSSSLNEQEINREFKELFFKYFGKTKITITVNPLDKESSLENRKILNFFSDARDVGLMSSSSVKISRTNNKNKSILANSEGDILTYNVRSSNINNLDDAHKLFQDAIHKN